MSVCNVIISLLETKQMTKEYEWEKLKLGLFGKTIITLQKLRGRCWWQTIKLTWNSVYYWNACSHELYLSSTALLVKINEILGKCRFQLQLQSHFCCPARRADISIVSILFYWLDYCSFKFIENTGIDKIMTLILLKNKYYTLCFELEPYQWFKAYS